MHGQQNIKKLQEYFIAVSFTNIGIISLMTEVKLKHVGVN